MFWEEADVYAGWFRRFRGSARDSGVGGVCKVFLGAASNSDDQIDANFVVVVV